MALTGSDSDYLVLCWSVPSVHPSIHSRLLHNQNASLPNSPAWLNAMYAMPLCLLPAAVIDTVTVTAVFSLVTVTVSMLSCHTAHCSLLS